MHKTHGYLSTALLACLLLAGGCAGTGTLVDAPTVTLKSVALESASLNRQTFLLGFDVANPNPFPLPVRAVAYNVHFDGGKFAGGETAGSFTVPARGGDAFMISVELDLLNTATRFASLLRGGMRDELAYALDGSLTVDIPFTRPIPFSSSGTISVQGGL